MGEGADPARRHRPFPLLEPLGRSRRARRLAWLDTTDVAQEVVKHVCRIGGSFDGVEGVSKAGHAEVLSDLAEIDTQVVADQIERCLADVEDLSEVEGDVRRHLEPKRYARWRPSWSNNQRSSRVSSPSSAAAGNGWRTPSGWLSPAMPTRR